MKSIRYSLHFLMLAASVVVIWLTKDYLPQWISSFDFFHYGLTGVLHAMCVVFSLRDRKAARPMSALCFITLAAAWGALTPAVALWTFARIPVPDHSGQLYLLLVYGSAIGASGYWLLVRRFWLKSLRTSDWFRTVILCMAATLLSWVLLDAANPKSGFFDPLVVLTAAWWFAFSVSLYWSETSEHPGTSTSATLRGHPKPANEGHLKTGQR
jgi:hypothetical protein